MPSYWCRKGWELFLQNIILIFYFIKDVSFYNLFRKQIYASALDNFENLEEFFYDDLVNNKIDGYVDKIKKDGFFAGIIEIYLAVKILNINIAIYERKNITDDYIQYAFFEPESGTNEIIIIGFENRGHCKILNTNNSNNTDKYYQNNTDAIKQEEFTNENKQRNQKASCHLKSDEELKD